MSCIQYLILQAFIQKMNLFHIIFYNLLPLITISIKYNTFLSFIWYSESLKLTNLQKKTYTSTLGHFDLLIYWSSIISITLIFEFISDKANQIIYE